MTLLLISGITDYRLEQNKDCLIIDRIVNGQWSWNWSRTNLGARNLAYLHDMLIEISLVDTNVVEDSCVWTLVSNGKFTEGDLRRIIESKILPSLDPSTT